MCLKCTQIAEIFVFFRKSGSRNTMMTSDFRPEVKIWPFRACAMHPSIIVGTVRLLWTWLWSWYHVPQNTFLVQSFILSSYTVSLFDNLLHMYRTRFHFSLIHAILIPLVFIIQSFTPFSSHTFLSFSHTFIPSLSSLSLHWAFSVSMFSTSHRVQCSSFHACLSCIYV